MAQITAVRYDTRGNLVDDGVQFMYDYDVAGNLTHVYLRESSGPGGSVSKGKLHARFRYDALNRKVSAVYDDNPDGFYFPIKTTEAVFENEVIEFYGYDERWRLVAVYRQNTKGTLNILTGANAPSTQRPPPALYERIIHRYVGRGGTGEGWFHDAPVYSQINKDWKFDIYGDDLIDGDENETPDPESGYTPDNDLCPTWEIERQYLQSQIDGDILGVIDYFADGTRQTTRFDYSMFGLPRLLPTNTVPGSAYGGDLDNDDNINNGLHPDGQSDISDLIAFLIMFENGDPRGDLANTTGHPIPDGGTDVSDLVYMLQQFQAGLSVTAEPVRFGWRAYQWDGRLNLYHVRHRTFDPKLIAWLQPDPLGEVDGLNVYAYCGWDPFNKIDPMGLEALGWGEFIFEYLLGGGEQGAATRGAFASGWKDGEIIVANVVTFGLNDDLRNASEQVRAAGRDAGLGFYYDGAHAAGWVAREAFILAATFGIGQAAQAGTRLILATHAGRDAYAAAVIFLAVHGADLRLVGTIVRYVLGTGAVLATSGARTGVGKTVLGHYPEYVQLAEQLGARRFHVPLDAWNRMTAAEQWAANVKFLDRTIRRGDEILLATPLEQVRTGSWLEREIKYLLEKGYQVSPDGTKLIPPCN
jgi:RHS repeat-associated protein